MKKSVLSWYESFESIELGRWGESRLGVFMLQNRKGCPNYPNDEVETLSEAIAAGFSWTHSPQGFAFWNGVYTAVKVSEELQKGWYKV